MKYLFLFLFLTVLLVSCQPVTVNNHIVNLLQWKYGDLKLLDPVDSIDANHDLIALYTRRNDSTFQIRVDFLDLVWMYGQDLYVLLDANPGGLSQVNMNGEQVQVDVRWDYLIIFPADGQVLVVDNNYSPISNLELFIVRNNLEDNISFSLNPDAFPVNITLTKLQVILAPQNGHFILDKTIPVSIDAPPPNKVKVVFLFWNTLTSSTPAGTLRSWDGAHSGPGRDRHGLRYLLDAAEKTNTPIVLMNLVTPQNLSALDYINVLSRIKALEKHGIIGLVNFDDLSMGNIRFLDEFAYSKYHSKNIYGNLLRYEIYSTEIMKNSDFYYLMNKNIYFDFGVYDYTHYLDNWSDCSFAVNSKTSVFSSENIPRSCKTLLLSKVFTNENDMVIFGGDFSKSILGNYPAAERFFLFIGRQPWIQVLSIFDFQSELDDKTYQAVSLDEHKSSNISYQIMRENNSDEFLAAYRGVLKAPKNQLSELAWQVFEAMRTQSSPDAAALSNNFIGQLGHIIEAAKWADHPEVIQTCEKDIDADGFEECIFSNEQFFLTIEPNGGYIPFIFTKTGGELHQIIGPTWELMLGISDPSSWDLLKGIYSDPGQILGALQNKNLRYNMTNIDFIEDKVIISSTDMTMRTTLRISDSTITIHQQGHPVNNAVVQFPIMLDPWTRFTKDWGDKYHYSKTVNGFIWGIDSGFSIEMISTEPQTNYYFNFSRNYIFQPEDPNFDYLPGHNLPFPMLLSEINASQDSLVVIKINP